MDSPIGESSGSYPPVGGRWISRNFGTVLATKEKQYLTVLLFLFKLDMFIVYVLYSESYSKIYIGYTSNLAQRFLSHNELAKKGYTIKFRPWKIIYSENFDSKSNALKREKELKSAKGRTFIWNLIKQSH